MVSSVLAWSGHVCLFYAAFFGGKTRCAIIGWSRGLMESLCTVLLWMMQPQFSENRMSRQVCDHVGLLFTWSVEQVAFVMRNTRGLKVPPTCPGGFMAQHDICGPQAHKMHHSVEMMQYLSWLWWLITWPTNLADATCTKLFPHRCWILKVLPRTPMVQI